MKGADALAPRLRHALIGAPVTPEDSQGRVDGDALIGYAGALAPQLDGVCVWAHTGRGLHRSAGERQLILDAFRAATSAPVLAAAGAPPGTEPTFAAEVAAAAAMAEAAAEGGADGVMVYPVSSLRAPDTRRARTLELHRTVADASGLPVIGFLLYEGAGGVSYAPSLLTELASRPEVVGVKIATLDDAVACQDAIAAIRAAGALAVTGEDRMFGPSLMWGAEAALVGIAAAAAGAALSRRVMRAWFGGEHAEFVAASARLDRFAAVTFRAPMDGYVQRMQWGAVAEGLIPRRAGHDALGCGLEEGERVAVEGAFEEVRRWMRGGK